MSDTQPVEITCLRCGGEAPPWITVLWQHEQDQDGNVQVLSSESLAVLCPHCAELVRDPIRTAVDKATV